MLCADALEALLLNDISEMKELDRQQAWLLKLCLDFLQMAPPLQRVCLGMPFLTGPATERSKPVKAWIIYRCHLPHLYQLNFLLCCTCAALGAET